MFILLTHTVCLIESGGVSWTVVFLSPFGVSWRQKCGVALNWTRVARVSLVSAECGQVDVDNTTIGQNTEPLLCGQLYGNTAV